MAIIEIVRGDGSGAARHLGKRLGWFAGIWAVSTVAFFGAAFLLHFLMPQ